MGKKDSPEALKKKKELLNILSNSGVDGFSKVTKTVKNLSPAEKSKEPKLQPKESKAPKKVENLSPADKLIKKFEKNPKIASLIKEYTSPDAIDKMITVEVNVTREGKEAKRVGGTDSVGREKIKLQALKNFASEAQKSKYGLLPKEKGDLLKQANKPLQEKKSIGASLKAQVNQLRENLDKKLAKYETDKGVVSKLRDIIGPKKGSNQR